MITIMSGDQVTISQLKEKLEDVKELNVELTDELAKSKDSRKTLLRANVDLKLHITNGQRTMNKEIDDLKVQRSEEKK